MDRKKITIPDILARKQKKEKLTMLTAYDYPTALLIDKAGIDMLLVGDSLGMVVLGYDSTVGVTMDEMIHHSKAVRRAVKYGLVVGDMPFMSYNVSREEAIANAGRFIKEAGCDAVKLEWVKNVAPITKAIVDSGIGVMGHIGLTPQTASQLGGFKVQGKSAKAANDLLDSAKQLEDAGCFSIVLECIPQEIASLITSKLSIPTIGIGAGIDCDGQVLVTHDLVGLFERFTPKFVKQYVNLSPAISKAISSYRDEVESGKFPSKEHTFTIKADELKKIKKKKKE